MTRRLVAVVVGTPVAATAAWLRLALQSSLTAPASQALAGIPLDGGGRTAGASLRQGRAEVGR